MDEEGICSVLFKNYFSFFFLIYFLSLGRKSHSTKFFRESELDPYFTNIFFCVVDILYTFICTGKNNWWNLISQNICSTLPKIYVHFTEAEEKVKRDVRTVKKFIEVALVLDKAMFDKRPHSSRKDVIHDAIQVVCTAFFPWNQLFFLYSFFRQIVI